MKKKILIAEDNRIIALDIKRQLQNMEYDVTSVVMTGEEAVDKCRTEKPDAVLMDIHLKGSMSGLEAASIIFEDLKIPIIHLSGSVKKIFEGKTSYPLFFLSKPFQKKELVDILHKTLSV